MTYRRVVNQSAQLCLLIEEYTSLIIYDLQDLSVAISVSLGEVTTTLNNTPGIF